MRTLVRDLMRRDFIQVSPEEPAEAVLQLMAMARVRALPVVEDGRVRGLVNHRDLAFAALGLTGSGVAPGAPVKDYLRSVEPVSPEAPLSEAARRMVAEALPCLVAVEVGEGRVIGLLTEGDLLRAAYASAARSAATAS